MGHIVSPFWQRLPQFFSYPFKKEPFTFIAILAVIAFIFHNSGLINILLWAVLLKYAYAVLVNTGQGKLEPPKFSVELITTNFFQVFKQYMLFFILAGGGFVVGRFWGALGSSLYMLCVVIFLPAMIMILVTKDCVVSALNPQYSISLVANIGGRYFQMYLFLLLLMGAPIALAGLSSYVMPVGATRFIMIIAQNYYTIVVYNLMGYVLLQYHEEIGYEVRYEDFQEQKGLGEVVAKGPNDDLINEVNVLVAEGRFGEAIDQIESVTHRDIKDLQLSTKYYNLLKTGERFAEMVYYGVHHLDLVVGKGDMKAACAVYKECLGQDTNFCPHSKTLYRVAGWLVQMGDNKFGINAYVKFIKADPENVQVPVAYYNIAKILLEKLGDKAKAAGVLKTVLNKYPGHEISMDAKRCLEEMASPS